MTLPRVPGPVSRIAKLAFLVAVASPVSAQDAPPPAPPPPPSPTAPTAAAPRDPLAVSEWLVLAAPEARVRRPIRPDIVFERHLLKRDAPPPKDGDALTGETGVQVAWSRVTPAPDGSFDGGRFQWAYAVVTCAAEQIVLLDASAAVTAWVNGDPVAGDPYAYGIGGVPVALQAGENRIYLSGLRGKVRFSMRAAPAKVHLATTDDTIPDAVRGSPLRAPAAFAVMNCTKESLRGLRLVVNGASPESDVETFQLPPLWVTKRRVPIEAPAVTDPERRVTALPYELVLSGPGVSERRTVEFPLIDAHDPRRVTHRSAVDGSVQEWGYLPADTRRAATGDPSLVLSLHGAGVDVISQVRSYSPRPSFAIAAPSNRRRFGFDWQDTGRTDAYEVMSAALDLSRIPRERVHLTGHSMGGHGAWHLAANDPDRWLSVAPSAGWISFDTYGGRTRTAISSYWFGSDGGSDTLALVGNVAQVPAFVVHGTSDDNVPETEGRKMVETLRAAGATPGSLFREGAGHWWDDESGPGAACVDHDEIFRHFAAHPPRPQPSATWWTCADPSIDAEHHFLRIEQPRRYGLPVVMRAKFDAASGVLDVTTENAAWIAVKRPDAGEVSSIRLDSQSFAVTSFPAWFRRSGEEWIQVGGPPPAAEKRAARSGPFKRVFDRRFAFVLPTKGRPEEMREAWARARFDAQQWWYRGNGAVTVLLDVVYAEERERLAGRNVVLYGNADSNAAWTAALGPSPAITVRRGSVSVDGRTFSGEGVAAFAVLPRADDPQGLCGVMGDSGAEGARIAFLHSAFSSGVGYPDYLVWGRKCLSEGDAGVLAAGFFGPGWTPDGHGFAAESR